MPPGHPIILLKSKLFNMADVSVKVMICQLTVCMRKKLVVRAKLKEGLFLSQGRADHKRGIGDLLGLKELMILQNHSRY